MFNPTQLNHYS